MAREWAYGLAYRSHRQRNQALPTLAQPLQHTKTAQLARRPATNQPRSQRPWVGQLARHHERLLAVRAGARGGVQHPASGFGTVAATRCATRRATTPQFAGILSYRAHLPSVERRPCRSAGNDSRFALFEHLAQRFRELVAPCGGTTGARSAASLVEDPASCLSGFATRRCRRPRRQLGIALNASV
jgi:hypothetical protein